MYADLDPAKAGILLTEDNGTLGWKAVSGPERPFLAIENRLGEISMGRPYMDEFLTRSYKTIQKS